MNIIIENCYGEEIEFDYETIADTVINAALSYLKCPYDCEVDMMLTDNDGICSINKEQRNIDAPTDVLSFPMLTYELPGAFADKNREPLAFHPDTGELMLGDIVISMDKVYEQSEAYGHSVEREFAFLTVHSILHLCGYDHMEVMERETMEELQEKILNQTEYTRG